MRVRVAIVGGGATGLATAAWLAHDHGIDDLVVLESEPRAGGKVRSETDSGHCLEWGPQGFLDNAPDTLELARLCGITEDLVRADEGSAARFILRRGKLRAVPLSPPAFLFSDILPLGARLRVLGEALGRGRPDHDESVFEFAARRIGRSAAEVLVDAMVTGVFAGDSRQLSLAATFPRMAAMEAEYGSLSRAMLAKMREARRSGRRLAGPAGPGGTLSTFRQGMGQLPAALARRLGHRLRLGARVERLERTERGLRLEGSGFELTAEVVLLALPAAAAAGLLAHLAPAAAAPLAGIPTVPIVVFMASYNDPAAFGSATQGFGFLVPGCERLGVLGTLFCHSIFPGQAPPGSILLRTMLGGAREPAAIDLDDDAVTERVRRAHRAVLGADPDPDRLWIIRHAEGISQYTIGHLERVAAAEQAARAAGIELAGSPFRGVSVNDCIRQARAAAARLAQRVAGD